MAKKKGNQKGIVAPITKKIPTSAAPAPFIGIKSMTNWLLILVGILPLLFSRITIDTNIAVRYLFQGSFILLFILIFYLPQLIKRKLILDIPNQIKLLFALGIAYIIWSIVSVAFAINPMEGYYEISRYALNLILLYIIMTTIIREESQILKICKVLTIMAFAQSLIGIMQNYDLGFTELPGNVVPFGLMGNRNVFGSAEVLLLPFAIYVLFKAAKEWKVIAIISLVTLVYAIILSQTRSAWLSASSILITSLIMVTIFSRVNRKKWLIGTGAVLGGIILLLFILFKSDEEGTLSKSVKERAASLVKIDTSKSIGGKTSTDDRLDVWKKTILLIKDNPVLGVGTGNWRIAILNYGTAGLRWADGYVVPDRPHNTALLITSENGIIGSILYFGVWLLVLILGFRVLILSKAEDRKILCILMMSGLIAFALDSMFSFPTERIEHSVYMTLMAGIILGLYSNSRDAKGKLSINNMLFIACCAIVIFNIFLGYEKYNFEVHANRAHAYDKINNAQEEINEVEEGKNSFITLDPNGTPIELYSGIGYKQLKNFDEALKALNHAKHYHPTSARVYNNLGTVYTDMKDYKKAIEVYKLALKYAPDFETVYKNLAVNYFLVENYAGCIDALSHVNVQSDPNLVALLNEAKRLESMKNGK